MDAANGQSVAEYRRRVCRAMDYLSRHLDDNPGVEEIARAAHFSKYHFSRIFKAVVGETVAEFARRLRLERAAHRLRYNPSLDITAVAHESGFSSSQNFATAFRKHYGVTPSEFRKNPNAGRTGENAGRVPGGYDALGSSEPPLSHERRRAMDVEVKTLPARRVAYARNVGPYGPDGCGKAFGELMRWAGPRGLVGRGALIGLCWDDPQHTPAEKCRYDACVEVPDGLAVDGLAEQTIDGGRYAVYRAEVVNNDFPGAWNRMYEWLAGSGYRPGEFPGYEVYLNDGSTDPEGKWRVEICVPVVPL